MNNSNAAPKWKLNQAPQKSTIHKKSHQTSVSPRKGRVPFSKAEISSMIIGNLILLVMTIAVISSQINFTKAQYSLQNINQEITVLHNRNVNTKQEISTLASRDRLLNLAKKYGLSMNDSNIRNVSK
jgi:cell division protein FtsL